MSTPAICWKIALKSSPQRVYEALATGEGRRGFWAVEAPERDGAVHFRFANGWTEVSPIVAAEPARVFEIVYFRAPTRFEIEPDGDGALLSVTATDVAAPDWREVYAGWVSVLLAMKAHLDFGIDLRNGDPARCWDAGFADQ